MNTLVELIFNDGTSEIFTYTGDKNNGDKKKIVKHNAILKSEFIDNIVELKTEKIKIADREYDLCSGVKLDFGRDEFDRFVGNETSFDLLKIYMFFGRIGSVEDVLRQTIEHGVTSDRLKKVNQCPELVFSSMQITGLRPGYFNLFYYNNIFYDKYLVSLLTFMKRKELSKKNTSLLLDCSDILQKIYACTIDYNTYKKNVQNIKSPIRITTSDGKTFYQDVHYCAVNSEYLGNEKFFCNSLIKYKLLSGITLTINHIICYGTDSEINEANFCILESTYTIETNVLGCTYYDIFCDSIDYLYRHTHTNYNNEYEHIKNYNEVYDEQNNAANYAITNNLLLDEYNELNGKGSEHRITITKKCLRPLGVKTCACTTNTHYKLNYERGLRKVQFVIVLDE